MPTEQRAAARRRMESQAIALARLRGSVFEYLVADGVAQDDAYAIAADKGEGSDLLDELLELIDAAKVNHLKDAPGE